MSVMCDRKIESKNKVISAYQNCSNHQRLVLEYLHNLFLIISVGPCVVHALWWIPGAGLLETFPRQLDDIQGKVASEALMVELYNSR